MRVDWAIPCRYVEVVQQPGGATIVGAGADTILVPAVPIPLQMLFAVRYVGAPDELDGETAHPIACRIFDPGGEQVGQQDGNLTAEVAQIVQGFVAEIIVPTALVIEAPTFGTFGVEFAIDDDAMRVPMHVVPQQ